MTGAIIDEVERVGPESLGLRSVESCKNVSFSVFLTE